MEMFDIIKDCKACELHKLLPNGCTPVPGYGVVGGIMFVGEAPGENEIIECRPFVGLSGKLLDKIIIEAEIDKNSIYIANTVNCRPHNNGENRPPTKDEIQACKGWLWQQIQHVKPKLIFTLGMIPTKTLLHSCIEKKTFKMKDVIGQKYYPTFVDCPVVPLYHPSFLLQHGRKHTQDIVKIIKDSKNEL